ncbi:MAG: conditioned medium factor [Aquimonas sp.]|nr:conditioned medium factor [Aquimonas sp.]
MKLKPLLLSTASALLLQLSTSAAAVEPLNAKQLAGPPSEFALMAAPHPAAGAVHSKAALVPIELSQDKSGRLVWRGQLPVEGPDLRLLLLADEGHSWQLDLRSPSGRLEKAAGLAKSIERGGFGMEAERFPSELYRFDGLQAGLWSAEISADAKSPRGGFLLIEGDPATELSSHPAHLDFVQGRSITLTAQLSGAAKSGRVLLGHEAGSVDRADLRVSFPDGRLQTLAMNDQGLDGDAVAGDGIYSGSFKATDAGMHTAQVLVHGSSSEGRALIRSTEHVIPVVEPSLQLLGDARAISAKQGGPERLSIEIPVAAAKRDQHYRAVAEVWGRDAKGQPAPVAWIGGMVRPEAGTLALGFDQRWQLLSGAQGPYELRNLRIEDPDHFVTVASAKSLPLALPEPSLKVAADRLQIDDSMRMGPRPAELDTKATGRRLVLVHGYCSAGVWPAAQFSTASTFLDSFQNRTHDQFAQRIRTFGAQWNSFGTVAHSQGGAASLHLYAFYWSGLDNATGGRRIQSVGTPYQGTNLAGVLAALGNLFGVGCGTNSNLTYSGAASWLAGVPTWARGQVNYYTTAFRSTNWWTNDYCNFASDLVLSDPEDGTVERTYGQLPGGINRGHVTGQCHTANMRDPAQYRDSSRNSVMNSNAAR